MKEPNWMCPKAPYSCRYDYCPGECEECGTHQEITDEGIVYCPECEPEIEENN